MKEKITITDLITKTKRVMTEEKFRKNTMIEYDRHWKRLAKYAEIEGTKYFTMEFVDHYLKDIFNYPEDRPTRSAMLHI